MERRRSKRLSEKGGKSKEDDQTHDEETDESVVEKTVEKLVVEDVPPVRKREHVVEDSRPQKKEVSVKSRRDFVGRKRQRTRFFPELAEMMYGFGDVQNPLSQTVDTVENIVKDYISEVAMKALRTGKQGRIDPEDVEFVVRHDAKKLNRIHAMFGFNNMKARHTAEDEMDASAIAILSERYAPPK